MRKSIIFLLIGIFILILSSFYVNAVVNDSISGYYNLSDPTSGSPSVVRDATRLMLNMTAIGSITKEVPGKLGLATKFTGAGNAGTCIYGNQNVPQFNLSKNFTLCSWLNFSSVSTQIDLFFNGANSVGSRGLACSLYAGGKIGCGKWGSDEVQTATTLSVNTWYYYCYTHSTNGTNIAYINGLDDNAVVGKQDLDPLSFLNYNFVINSRTATACTDGSAGSNYVMDETAIWNRTLTQNEIYAAYSTNLNGSALVNLSSGGGIPTLSSNLTVTIISYPNLFFSTLVTPTNWNESLSTCAMMTNVSFVSCSNTSAINNVSFTIGCTAIERNTGSASFFVQCNSTTNRMVNSSSVVKYINANSNPSVSGNFSNISNMDSQNYPVLFTLTNWSQNATCNVVFNNSNSCGTVNVNLPATTAVSTCTDVLANATSSVYITCNSANYPNINSSVYIVTHTFNLTATGNPVHINSSSVVIEYNSNNNNAGTFYNDLALRLFILSNKIYCNFNNTYVNLSTTYQSNGELVCQFGPGLFQLSYNGTIVNSSSITTSNAIQNTKYLGYNGTNSYYNGTISKFMLYNRTLSSDEIYIMNARGNFTNNKLNESASAISLNGNEIIMINNNSINSGNVQKSICVWSKPATSSNMVIFDSGSISAANLMMLLSGAPIYSPYYTTQTGNAYTVNQWMHLCYTYDGAIGNLYQDGSLVSTAPQVDIQRTQYLHIGGENLTNPFYPNFNGSIDEFMFFAYALTASEVSTLYHGYDLSLRDCSFGGIPIMNFTMYDEDTLSPDPLTAPQMQANINLYNPVSGLWYNYTSITNSNNLQICMQNATIFNSTFQVYSIVQYSGLNYVTEFHYNDNVLLNWTNVPSNIALYDLTDNRSTTFLVTYQDENYLYIPNAIIDLQRKYISQGGNFYSVEQGKTDSSGQTRLHMVTEDVIYKFNVWINGTLTYSSDEYLVLCQTTPCTVTLKKPYSQNVSLNPMSNILYSMSSDAAFLSSNNIQFNYTTIDGTSPEMTLYVTKNSILGLQVVCNTSVTSSSGSINCPINASYSNATYAVNLYKDSDLLGVRQYSMTPTASSIFGPGALFFGAIVFLSLSMMAIASPIIAIIIGLIVFILLTVLNIIQGGSVFGIGSSILWLIIAAVIIIWKMIKRGSG